MFTLIYKKSGKKIHYINFTYSLFYLEIFLFFIKKILYCLNYLNKDYTKMQ